jgi:hypothetical protein
MAIGPVQLIVLGFEHPQFHGEIIAELEHGSTTAHAWVTATREDRTMEASEPDVLGPVDYLVVEFRGCRRNSRRRQARSRPLRGPARQPRPRNLPVDVASRSASGSPVRPRLRAGFDAIKADALA